MHRIFKLAVGLSSVVLLSACPGSLANPDDFGDGGVIEKDAETILAESCGTTGCHDDTPQAQLGLDLLSPGVESRVVDVNAVTPGCTDRIFVVAGDPDSSYLLDKILDLPDICGTRMPLLDSLPADEIEVLREWIIDLGASSASELDGG